MLEVLMSRRYHATMTHEETAFDLFWRNPFNYWRQMQEIGESDIAWDRGLVKKMAIDPFLFSSIKFTKINPNWRCYIIGQQDAQEYDATCSIDNPKGSYPTFDWERDELETLEFYLKNPWGEDATMYKDTDIPKADRAVKGQAHKVFVTNIPPLNTIAGRHAIALLEEINRNWSPYAHIFIHRLYGFINLFGRGFNAGSMDGRDQAQHGRIQLINGKKIDPRTCNPDDVAPHLAQFGFVLKDMESASNRCLFNMQAAKYASNNYRHEGRPLKRLPRTWQPDITSPDSQVRLPSPKG